jgi:6-phosphogluconolactonase
VYYFLPEGDSYRLADTRKIPGGYLCHITYSRKHKMLMGACYQSGEVFTLPVGEETFGGMRSYIKQENGDGALTRAHCVELCGEERYVYAANIALDRVYRYGINTAGLCELSYIQLDSGVGPRHICLVGNIMYIITEYSNEIITYKINKSEAFSTQHASDASYISNLPINRISTLPEGFTGKSYCSTLCYLPTGNRTGFIYAANRGANTIALFGRGADGALTKIRDFSCMGDWPRHIAIIGKETETPLLAVANERSGYVTLCNINADTGYIGEPFAAILFGGASYIGTV